MQLTLKCPYLCDSFVWLKGNLHTHTTESDGTLTPDAIARAYAERGYGFLCLSDHDRVTWPVEAPEGLILLPGLEVGGGPHVLAVGVETGVPPTGSRQDVLDAITQAGGLAILCHPNWEAHYNHFPQDVMEQLRGYAGIEIWNGVVEFLEGSALATDRWDRLLSGGRRVWGFAHDDAHHDFAVGRAWVVAQVRERSRGSVLEALGEGRFYSSTGVTIERIEVDGDDVLIEAPDADRIRFYGQWGRLVHEAEGSTAGYRVGGREGLYVRAECWGRGGRCAWTQPLFVVSEESCAGDT